MLIRFTGIFVAAALTAGVANAKDITLRWGHYLGDSPFLQAEKDFATKWQEKSKDEIGASALHADAVTGDAQLELTVLEAHDPRKGVRG
mgnify:CR=1 FL=1